jgi:glycyl-tRNA synthetase beta chain
MRYENLLVEIGTEELPPKSLSTLATAFADNLQAELVTAELEFASVTWYATPRRLAVFVTSLAEQQKDSLVEVRGPAVTAAFDDQGQPSRAAQGWAKSNGIEVSEAQRLITDKGEWLLYKASVKGKAIGQVLPALVEKSLAKLPIAKPMRWGTSQIQFIRPVHSFTMLYGADLLSGCALGKDSARLIFGHRFHGDTSFQLTHADEYLAKLNEHFVIADYHLRRARILEELSSAAKIQDAIADIDDALLDEVTSLVEWPVVLTASFSSDFLNVPKEALIYTMKGDQKYFPLLDSKENLKSHFLFVSNIQSKDPSQVIEGNEKVIRPRLADAEFFFRTDKKQTLESRLESLSSVLFQKQLGTLLEKSQRISVLAGRIADLLGVDNSLAERAGLLSKTDLMTNMVMEFPDVQGTMGMHYAMHDGEDTDVSKALFEQYLPRFSGDILPQTDIGCCLALAEKFDTLVGIFGIGQIPKGDKDPFALRRAAIGVIRIIVELELPLDLTELAKIAAASYGQMLSNDDVEIQVVDFVLARFRNWFQEQGIDIDVIQAVSARRPTRPADFSARIKGVNQFKAMDSSQALAAANKRVANILAKNNVASGQKWKPELLVEAQEKALAEQLLRVEKLIAPLLLSGSYGAVLFELAALRPSIDAFFDGVMVMVDDKLLQSNRLALLADLREKFLQCADISLLG